MLNYLKLHRVTSAPCVVVWEWRLIPAISRSISTDTRLAGSLEARPFCTCNGQLWKPKPSLQPSLLRAVQWGPVPWLEPLPQINQADTHTHTRTYTQMHLMPLSVSLFIPAGSLSLIQGLVIGCPWLFVSSFILEHKGRFLLLRLFSFKIYLHSPCRLWLHHVAFLFVPHHSLFSCYDMQCVKMLHFQALCLVMRHLVSSLYSPPRGSSDCCCQCLWKLVSKSWTLTFLCVRVNQSCLSRPWSSV